MDRKFKIDIFELGILAVASIPPAPAVRNQFFNDLTDVYHKQMTPKQRTDVFIWVTREDKFNVNDKDCELFSNRFNPDNQFLIHIDVNGQKSTEETFYHNGRYHLNRNTSIAEEFIVKAEGIK